MKIFALQTDVGVLKHQFLVEGEEQEIITVHRHIVSFFVEIFWATLLTIILCGLFVLFLSTLPDLTVLLTAQIILGVWFLIYAYVLFSAFINWQYNLLMLTTEKLVVVKHHSCWYQHVQPIHLEKIMTTQMESQFGGIFRCGIVHFKLQETSSGSSSEVRLYYIPEARAVIGSIENAITLKHQRGEGGTAEQKEQVQEVREKVHEAAGEATPNTP